MHPNTVQRKYGGPHRHETIPASQSLRNERVKAITDLDSNPDLSQIFAEVVAVGDMKLEGVAQGVATVFVQVLVLHQNKQQFRYMNNEGEDVNGSIRLPTE